MSSTRSREPKAKCCSARKISWAAPRTPICSGRGLAWCSRSRRRFRFRSTRPSPSSPTTCSRRPAFRISPPSCCWANLSNSRPPRTSSPHPATSGPRITSPAASAEELDMTMTEHTVHAYDDELASLKTMLAQMGGLAEELLEGAIESLVKRDVALADKVIAGDQRIDQLEHQVEEKAILTIAKRQPMARDLREIMVAIRISSDLERIGDLAKNTAKRTHAISDPLPRKLVS